MDKLYKGEELIVECIMFISIAFALYSFWFVYSNEEAWTVHDATKIYLSCQGLYYCYELMCSDSETACEESLLISSSLLERSLGDVSPLLEKAFKHNIHSVLYMLTFL